MNKIKFVVLLALLSVSGNVLAATPSNTYCSSDTGATWNPCPPAAGGGGSTTANQGTPNTAANGWPVYLEFGGVALNLGATTASGSIPVVLANNVNVPVVGAGAAGSAVAGNPVLQAGSDGTNARTITTDTAGNQIVVGAAASGATAVGNPVGVGGVFNTTAPTLTNGQRGDIQLGTRGSIAVTLFASNSVNGPLINPPADAGGSQQSLYTSSYPEIFNGTSFDRARSAGFTTGIAGVAMTATGTPITASANGASTSNVVATLASAASKTTYITGFDVTCLAEATTAANTTIVISGIITGSQTYEFTQATLVQSAKVRSFAQPIPASASVTAIVVTLTGVTGGGTCSVNAEGFQF